MTLTNQMRTFLPLGYKCSPGSEDDNMSTIDPNGDAYVASVDDVYLDQPPYGGSIEEHTIALDVLILCQPPSRHVIAPIN